MPRPPGGSPRGGAGRRDPGRPDPGRALLAWSLLLGTALLALMLATGTVPTPAGAAETRQGGELYQRWCATCHGNDGLGTRIAPALDDFTVTAVDLSIRTDRMPLADPERGVRERTFTDEERVAVVAYLTELVDLEGEIPEPPPGEPATGREVYTVHCAQCHGATGKGGVGGDGVIIPAVQGLDPVTIAAATRAGPFQMPQFGTELISEQEIGDIAAFLDEEVHEPTSPLGLAELSKIEAAGAATLLGVGVLGVCAWAGGARSRARHEPQSEPQDGR